MANITLEPGGSRPPTDLEASNIRKALGLGATLADADFQNVVVADSPLTIANNGMILFVDATDGDIDIYLPDITPGKLQTTIVKRLDDSLNTVTVYPSLEDEEAEIEKEVSKEIAAEASYVFHGNGEHWWITSFSRSDLISA